MPGRLYQGMAYIQGILYDGGTVAADACTVALLKATLWAAGTFALGDIVYVGSRGGSNDNVFVCTTAGTSVSGPTGTGTGIADGGTARWAHMKSATLADLTAGSAEPSGGGYARQTIAATATTVSAAGVMTHTPVSWGTGVTSIVGCELWLLIVNAAVGYAWGWLGASRTIGTNDTLSESITDTPS